ncbi:MAG: phosphatidylglycerophosphatase A [Planctomycetes bacterium]|nr:phosphatidylglycerophosphatase A [Planctomycetota bacterium]
MTLGDRFRFALVTGFGTGLAPFAPGTFGTIPGVAIGVGIEIVCGPSSIAWVTAAVAAVLLAVGCAQTEFTRRAFGSKDPGAFVLDEIVGVLVAAAIGQAFAGPLGVVGWSFCFALFRVFDITKVWPARSLEAIPGAPGIMLDDVAAGVWSGALLIVAAALGWF